MPVSDIKPIGIQVTNLDGTLLDEYLYVDIVIKGRARIYGRYNITTITQEQFGKTYTNYTYDEQIIYWTPPSTYIVNDETIILDITSRESVESYVASNSFEIMGYVKQSNSSW